MNLPSDPAATLSRFRSDDAGAWWVILAVLKTDSTDLFVYGAAAPCSDAPGWTDRLGITLPGGELEITEHTVTRGAFDAFDAILREGFIDLTQWFGQDIAPLPVVATRRVIQPALGQTAALARLHCTLPPLASHMEDGSLTAILTALEEKTGLPFTSSYAPRIGNFEVFELHGWLNLPPPVLCEPVGPRDLAEAPQTWEIARTPAFAQEAHTAHFVGLAGGDTIIDRLIPLAAGVPRTTLTCPEPLDQFTFRLFGADGSTLLHLEEHALLRQIGLTMSPILRQTRIEDDLSRRAAQGGAGLARATTTVRGKTSQRSMIGAPAKGSWRHFADVLLAWIARRTPHASSDRWFPRGIGGEVGVIDWLNALMSGAHVRAAVLVDPWFGVDALERLIPRLDSLDLELTIVTSWSSSDPDTGRSFGTAERAVARLEESLDRVRPLVNPALTVINLADGGDQAFHDRYLLLYPHEGAPQVFLMSNSLNRAAAKWSFAMSQLADDIAPAARNYIEGLLHGEDRSRGWQLTRDFHWSTRAP